MIFFSQLPVVSKIYLFGIFLLIVALPLSMFLMSLAQFILIGAWILEGNIGRKIKTAFANPVFIVLAGVYLVHLIGLINTSDFDYAFRDLRIKLPLVILTLVFISSAPLETNHFHLLLKFFITAVVTSSFISILVYAGIIHRELHNIRDISIFISHIRLALLVCVAIVCCVYFIRINVLLKMKFLYAVIIIYLTAFLLLLESLTGISILICLALFFAVRFFMKQSRMIAGSGLVFILVITFIGVNKFYKFLFIESVKESVVNYQTLPKFTALGNAYYNDTTKQDEENGHLVWITICNQELDAAWNKRSRFLISGKDERGQDIKFTLIRFLASKNLTRDAEGVAGLSKDEIHAIEKGIANVDYTHLSDIGARFHQLAWEYRQYHFNGNPSGHSVMQRYEFWKTALFIISKHPLTGVGTGDVQLAFDNAYKETNSSLALASRFRAHNQYLTMAVAFGIFGGLYFIFSLFFPVLSVKKYGFLYSSFLLIAVLSMLNEDTLETQAGVTFFTFFNSFFLTQKEA